MECPQVVCALWLLGNIIGGDMGRCHGGFFVVDNSDVAALIDPKVHTAAIQWSK